MIKETRKILTTGAILLLVIGMTGCSKNTSIVDKIANKQYGTVVQTPSETNVNLNNSTGETEDKENTEDTENAAEDTEVKGIDLQAPEQNILDASIGEDNSVDEENAAADSQVKGSEGDSGIDVDLTKLSSTMVYSEVYNMMNKPEDYVGKTIKIEGVYYASYWQDTEKYYHCVLISDATACCQNGIEFVWDNDTHVYPDEYPPDNTVIELTGVFGLYEEMGETYCYLKTDNITVR
ncbi:MAG: hypothetical protein K0S04_3526 [Herbinix sp.]|jgi:hypothetical protein|nr:hypothetical protein [Herbinix sp.]